MVGVVTAALKAVGLVGALDPVALGIVFQTSPLLLRIEGRAGHFVFEMFRVDLVVEFAVVVACDAFYTIRPGPGQAQVQFSVGIALGEDFLDLHFGIGVGQELVGDRADHAMALITPGRRGIRREKENQAANGKQQSQHHRLAELAR